MVEQQRQMYEQAISGSERLRALVDHLEEPDGPRALLGGTNAGELEVSDVMDEVGRILSAYESGNG
jgi:hypothetical protein